MKRNGQLSDVLHILLHMAEVAEPITSDDLARMLKTNPVVVRRTMAGLRSAGLVRSGKGHGGGWKIVPDLADITLRDVYDALGKPALFALGNRSDAPDCLVEQAVNTVLDSAFAEAEMLLLDRFGAVTLAQLGADFHARLVARGISLRSEVDHHAA